MRYFIHVKPSPISEGKAPRHPDGGYRHRRRSRKPEPLATNPERDTRARNFSYGAVKPIGIGSSPPTHSMQELIHEMGRLQSTAFRRDCRSTEHKRKELSLRKPRRLILSSMSTAGEPYATLAGCNPAQAGRSSSIQPKTRRPSCWPNASAPATGLNGNSSRLAKLISADKAMLISALRTRESSAPGAEYSCHPSPTPMRS